jgi:hypothetical protein
VGIPQRSKKEKEKVASHPRSCVLNLGASHDMESSQYIFSSMDPYTTLIILMGDSTPNEVCRKGSIEVANRKFQNIISIPSLSTNMFSIYQITHLNLEKGVEFTLDPMSLLTSRMEL